MTTEIQILTAEIGALWVEITQADEIATKMGRPVEEKLTGPEQKDISALESFFDEASSRVIQIEDYIMTLRPKCLADAMILLSIAVAIYRDTEHSRYLGEHQKQMLPRLLDEVLAFLERETGQSADTIGLASIGARGKTWEDKKYETAALVARLNGIASKAA